MFLADRDGEETGGRAHHRCGETDGRAKAQAKPETCAVHC